MNEDQFRDAFTKLTDHGHFPWQWEMYKLFIEGTFPSSCSLPTGLGKTSIIHIWLLALAHAPEVVPRRLVYVVNRRTVVDQSTEEARRLRDRLGEMPDLVAKLKGWCAFPHDVPLAISTLRGQFADNRSGVRTRRGSRSSPGSWT